MKITVEKIKAYFTLLCIATALTHMASVTLGGGEGEEPLGRPAPTSVRPATSREDLPPYLPTPLPSRPATEE